MAGSVQREAVEPVSFITRSTKRKNLLLFLRSGPKTLREIREGLKVSSSGIIPQIRKLEARGLLHKNGNRYMLTQMGSVIAEHLCRLEGTIRVFEQNPQFWVEHDVCAIPEEFRLRLYQLSRYEVIGSTLTNVLLPHQVYVKHLLKSKWVKEVSPVLHPEYPEVILQLIEGGVSVSLVVTEKVLEELRKSHPEELERILSGGARLLVCRERVGVALAVTDLFVSLRLFLRNGSYDFHQNLISFETSAIKFGEALFSHYARRSALVSPETLLPAT
ncbi:MAG: winged helix-turn-helix domain-containing protein [Euryarchaeota archaeon]|nr:winged helix-turn-helix domain-containing protein [Euryarchaeota archaeon]